MKTTLKFAFNVRFFFRPTNFLSREGGKKRMLSIITSISSPTHSPSFFSPSSPYIEHTFKKQFVKLDKRRERANIFSSIEKNKNTFQHDIHMNTLFDIEHWLNMSTSATSWSFILR